MKLGVNTVLFKPFSVLEAMQAIQRAGYDGVELSAIKGMCEHLDLDNWNLDEVKAQMAKASKAIFDKIFEASPELAAAVPRESAMTSHMAGSAMP